MENVPPKRPTDAFYTENEARTAFLIAAAVFSGDPSAKHFLAMQEKAEALQSANGYRRSCVTADLQRHLIQRSRDLKAAR